MCLQLISVSCLWDLVKEIPWVSCWSIGFPAFQTIRDAESRCSDLEEKLQEAASNNYYDMTTTKMLDEGFGLIYEYDVACNDSNIIRRLWKQYDSANKISLFKEKYKRKLEEGPSSSASSSSSSSNEVITGKSYDFEPVQPIGLEEKMETVVNLLLDESNCSPWVWIHGIPGSGKTLLSLKVQEEERIKKHFGDKIFWMYFGKDITEDDVKKNLCKKLKNSDTQEEDLTKVISEMEKLLLILDDVWDSDENNILTPSLQGATEKNGHVKILVTSRREPFDTRMHAPRVKMGKLENKDDAKKVMCIYAFGGKSEPPDEIPHDIIEDAVEACEGLPLLLKLFGRLMSSCHPDVENWKSSVAKLQRAKQFDDDHWKKTAAYYARLKISYDALPHSKHQNYFLYLTVLPRGAHFDLSDFDTYWEAEGLADNKSEFNKIVWKLEQYGLIERFRKQKKIGPFYLREYDNVYKLHDILHDLAVHILDKERKGSYFNFAQMDLKSFCKKNRLRRIALADRSNESHRELERLLATKHVTTLHLRNLNKLTEVSFLVSFPNLKILALSNTSISVLPDCVGSLTHLITLDVSWNSKLKKIEFASIVGLTKLSNLDFRDCPNLEDFPFDALLSLTSLRFLRGSKAPVSWLSRLKEERRGKTLEEERRLNGFEKVNLNFGILSTLTEVWIDTKISVVIPETSDTSLPLRLLHIDAPSIEISTTFWYFTNLEDIYLNKINQVVGEAVDDWGRKMNRVELHLECTCSCEFLGCLRPAKIAEFLSLSRPTIRDVQENLRLSRHWALMFENPGFARFRNMRLSGWPLSKFTASGQGLEQLDVSDSSSMIDTVCLQNCRTLQNASISASSINILRVQNCPKLQDLRFNCKSMKTVQVQNCPKLGILDLTYCNMMETVSLQNCPELRELKLHSNTSPVLELENCPNCKITKTNVAALGFLITKMIQSSRRLTLGKK